LGYHSKDSFGATPYLIVRPSGNIMIDTPRFNENLAKNIEAQGQLEFIILTHKDDVADHERLASFTVLCFYTFFVTDSSILLIRWHQRFPSAKRIIHRFPLFSCQWV
jgi:hypothetical protein